jgi:threonylcarbamoyladenosine tRNA methylthiotransferase MtaB
MPAFLIQTLGCKLNQLESEAIADAYSCEGYKKLKIRGEKKPAKDLTDLPSVIVINTCTVTSKADQKARRVIRKALRDYPDAKVIVTGCYAQLNKDDILKLENDGKGRLLVVGKDNILNFPQALKEGKRESEQGKIGGENLFQFNPQKFSQHTRSFLKIQDGCDKNCTYCKIRLARGKSVSLNAEEALKRLRVLEETHAEAVLTGVNISQYKDQGREKNVFNLSELLDYLLSGTEKIAIRLSSLAPESADEKLVKILSHPRIRPHFHLSIQSLSDKILKKMGRTYNAQTAEKAIELLRSVKDDPFLACDIITGFPGETEIEFEETYNLCKKLDFAWIHVFPFSKREGTPAFSFSGCVAESEVTRRTELLTDLAKRSRAEYTRRWLGKDVDVLVEREKDFAMNGTKNFQFCGSFTNSLKDKINKLNFCNGVSQNYLKVLIRCEGKVPSAGTVVKCKLIEAGDLIKYDVMAVLNIT